MGAAARQAGDEGGVAIDLGRALTHVAHAGANHARDQLVDQHIGVLRSVDFTGQCAGERTHGAFRGRIGGTVGDGLAPGIGAEVEHAAVAPLQHAGKRRVAAQGHAVHIGANGVEPIGDRGIEKRPLGIHGGVVHQDVDPAELSLRVCEQASHVFGL